MKDSKLLKIAGVLNPEEWKYLRWFAQSNYFSTDPNLLAMYESLAKHYPSFSSKAFSKEKIYGRVYVGQVYHDGKWRNLVSKMTKLLEDYLVWLELEQNEFARKKTLTAAFGRRNLFEYFEKSTLELSNQTAKEGLYSAEALRERALLNLQYYHHPNTPKVANAGVLQSALDDLDHYYFAEKLRLASDVKVFDNMVSGVAPVKLLRETQLMMKNGELKNYRYLELYSRILEQLSQETGVEEFQQTVDFFSQVVENLLPQDRQFGLLHLLNYAINQANRGVAEYRSKVLELYKMGLNQNILISEEVISANTFINISSYASTLGEFAWTEEFILNYEKYLEASIRQDAKTISYGYLFFNQKEYDETIKWLQNYSFSDFNIVLISRMLLIRSYYELFERDKSYFDMFISYSKAFGKLIKREKLLSVNKKSWYQLFVVTLTKIARLNNQSKLNEITKSKLIENIKSRDMMLKQWLLSKLRK